MEKKDIQKLADLAKINISPEEEEGLFGDINSILEYVGKIQKVVVDVDREKEVGIPHNVMREDENPHEKGLYTKDILQEAPLKDGKYFKVKKIL